MLNTDLVLLNAIQIPKDTNSTLNYGISYYSIIALT